MRTPDQILELLPQLDQVVADELEDQDLDFKCSVNPSGKAHSRIDWEAAKTRVLSVMMQRHQSAQEGLRNAEIRALTHFDRNQVFRLMRELQEENPQVSVTGHGVSARHVWNS